MSKGSEEREGGGPYRRGLSSSVIVMLSTGKKTIWQTEI